MKLRTMFVLAAGVAGLVNFTHAQTTVNFPDATGEVVVPGSPFPHLDITGVDVTLDAAEENLTFTIQLAGDPVATNWGKYMIGIRSGAGGTSSGNGWNRPINFASGMTHWIGGWADGGGGLNLWAYGGSSWSEIKASYDAVNPLPAPVINSNSYSVTVPVALLGYTPGPGQVLTFDVFSSGGGGGDGAVDALSAATTSIGNWGNSFTTTAPLSFPDAELPPLGDEDGDGYLNGGEVDGTSALGYVSNPFIPNYDNMNVAGSFNSWSATLGDMTQGDTSSLVTQYQWSLDRHFTQPALAVEYKFTSGGSFDIEWGQGTGAGAVVRGGGNIQGFVGASGIYRISFDQKSLTQSFTRRTFSSLSEFLSAYGLADGGGNADGDNLDNAAEYAANTDPLSADSDGDGSADDADTLPLVQVRDITFSVNMNVQIEKGNFEADSGFDVKLLVFTGNSQNYQDPYNMGGYTMEDNDLDGIYTVTLNAVQGFANQPFGQYKFFNTKPGAPNSGYEEGSDRNFNLGSPGSAQVLGTVFFSNDQGNSYTSWANANAGGGGFTADFDGDGVENGLEYFFGATGSSFTSNPVPVNGVVSWPRSSAAVGVGYKVWQSATLAAGSWVDVTASADTSDPNFVKFTLPTTPGSAFVRFEVFEQP